MARYLIFTPALVEGRYVEAAMGSPTEIDIPDTTAPSRRWKPLDDSAVAALAELGIETEIYDPQVLVGQSLSHVWPSKDDSPASPDPVRANGFGNNPDKKPAVKIAKKAD
jgi:hypothetical protein